MAEFLQRAERLAARWSMEDGVRFGARLGGLAHAILLEDRRRVLRQLADSFPEWTDSEVRACAREVFRNLGRSFVEVVNFPRIDQGWMDERIVVANPEVLADAHAAGRGVIYITGHIGNWELLAAQVAFSGYPLTVLARDNAHRYVTEWTFARRELFGTRSVVRGGSGGARESLRTLKSGGVLGILMDQDTRVGGVFVDYFGRPAFTPSGPAALARKTGAPVVFGFIHREGEFHHRIHYHGPMEVTRQGDPAEEIQRLTALFTATIEAEVRSRPEQWVWMHERWRRRPEDVEADS